MMHRTARALSTAVFLSLGLGAAALAAHNTVTVAVATSTRLAITGSVQVRNTITPAQTGTLTLVVFQVKDSGKVQERDRLDLGTVTVPAGPGSASPAVPYTVDTSEGHYKKGTFIILADFDNPAVAHTHCGTKRVVRDF
jgi:hypothetical protein